jgi:hypothetical protein
VLADEDIRRLLEARHDVNAVEDPAVVATTPAEAAMVAQYGNTLEAARSAHRRALGLLAGDLGETDEQYAKFIEAKAAAVTRYGHVRTKVQEFLLNPDPDEKISATELVRRGKVFTRSFGLSRTALEELAQDDLIETLKPIVTTVKTLTVTDFGEGLNTEHRYSYTRGDK